LKTQILMAKDALRDLEGDLKYLTDGKIERTVLCPTCGTSHENGFPVRLELIDDAATIRRIISELLMEAQKTDEALSGIQAQLNRVKLKTQAIERTLQVKKGAMRLQDVVDSHSADVIRGAFGKDMDFLKEKVSKLEAVAAEQREKAAEFDLPERVKDINRFYAERIELFATELGVRDLRDDVKKKPDASISASGSALPRSLLAYQFAVLHTASEKGDAKLFPIVVDSPNQQGQDADHLAQMLKFIVKRAPLGQQLILAVEEKPKDLAFEGAIIELEKPYSLLSKDEYDSVFSELKNLVSDVADALDARFSKQRSEVAKED
jgi:hypothetical protein